MNSDFADFFALLNQHGVEFLIIGGVAYNFHAPPRATKDIDVWVRPTRDNLERLIHVLEAFGLPIEAIDIEDLEREQRVLMIGRAPTRIDVLTRPDGLDWAGAWSRRVTTDYGDVPVGLLAIEDLISSKRAAGRPRDLADVSTLEKILVRNRTPRRR
ncbi:MAG TPA: hypothetical protein VK034_23115 [Enhygromyxa sp.]|nr:hypothetical protein [Enhygromyxa sp.]